MNFLPFRIMAVWPELFLMGELTFYIITQEGITWISRRSELSLPAEEKN